jgi:hypothetical protein
MQLKRIPSIKPPAVTADDETKKQIETSVTQ